MGDAGCGGLLTELLKLERYDIGAVVIHSWMRRIYHRRRCSIPEREQQVRDSMALRTEAVATLLLLSYPRLRGSICTHSSASGRTVRPRARERRSQQEERPCLKAVWMVMATVNGLGSSNALAQRIFSFIPVKLLLPAPSPPANQWFLRFAHTESTNAPSSIPPRPNGSPFQWDKVFPIKHDLALLEGDPTKPKSYVKQATPQYTYIEWWRCVGKLFGTIRGDASNSTYFLNEAGPLRAWLAGENEKRRIAGSEPLPEWRTLRNTGKGTRQNIGVEFCIEVFLNTEVMLRYLEQISTLLFSLSLSRSRSLSFSLALSLSLSLSLSSSLSFSLLPHALSHARLTTLFILLYRS